MPHTRYITLLALAAGLITTGCGTEHQAATTPLARVAATPAPKSTPVPKSERGPYYESNRASQKCLKLIVERERNRCLDRVEKRFHVNDIEDAEPTPKPQTIKECLTDAGFTTEVDADIPTMVTVNGDDGMPVAILEQQATTADAKEVQTMIDDMKADTKAQAEEDGWSADTAEDIPSERIGRYLVTYLYPEDGEQDAIHNCVQSFTKGN